MIEHAVEIPTRDGSATTFIAHPERDPPFPIVLVFMDAPGIREELRDLVRRIASAGYYAMLPNLYHRQGVLELSDPADEARRYDLMGALTVSTAMDDVDALLDFADRDAAASPGRAAAVGYGMGGPFAVCAAARHPERIAAAASLCGVHLVTDRPDSPHLAARKAKAEFYFGCAEDDRWAPLETVEALEMSLKSDQVNAEVEVFPGLTHGFVFPGRSGYDRAGCDRHWERLLALLRRTLG